MATRGSYPHPVLDTSDDVAARLDVFNVTITPSVDDVELRFQIRMTDPGIQALLDEGSARYRVRWTCSSTIASGELMLNTTFQHSDSTSYIGWIDQEDIRRTVRVEVTIIAAVPIEAYHLASQHSDYGGATFAVEPGDLLADGGFFEFEPDKLYDPLKPPVGSCFRFVSDPKQRKGLRVQFHDDEVVVVVFPEKVLPGFAALGNRPDLQISLVVLPALMQTIAFMKENVEAGAAGEDLTDRNWFRSVKSLVDGVGSFDDPPFELAQRILGDCLQGSLMLTLEGLEDEE